MTCATHRPAVVPITIVKRTYLKAVKLNRHEKTKNQHGDMQRIAITQRFTTATDHRRYHQHAIREAGGASYTTSTSFILGW